MSQEQVPLTQPTYQQAAYQQQPVYIQPGVPGQSAYGIPVAYGMWRSGVFECLESIPNSLMALFCPCISVAQIAARLGAFGGYIGVIFAFLVLFALHGSFTVVYNYHVAILDSEDNWTPEGIKREHITTYGTLSTAASLLPAILVAILRTRTRRLFRIQGSECEDFICSYCCSCCTIAQLATQVQSYTPGQCSFGPPDTLPAYNAVGNTLV
ncbi:hypothetical protein AC1031_021380 [Aphanomyces cochlioides]|nr:hypothetical protein AC1031_021380 [Aphanomyces cochlioides]